MKRKELTFDGFGINGPDEYRTRLATFERSPNPVYTPSQIKYYGKLFERSPELLELLRKAHAHIEHAALGGTWRRSYLKEKVLPDITSILKELES